MMSRTALVFVLMLFVRAAAAYDFSVYDVVAKAKQFNGKRVSVIGYFVAAHEEICLYPTRKAALRARRGGGMDLPHVLWLEFVTRANEAAVSDHYGRFTGRLRYRRTSKDEPTSGFGQWGLFSCRLDVESYEPMDARSSNHAIQRTAR
jgi:hypothetical protein